MKNMIRIETVAKILGLSNDDSFPMKRSIKTKATIICRYFGVKRMLSAENCRPHESFYAVYNENEVSFIAHVKRGGLLD